jgi:serine phosphatase RsbU (regulator of sigma subunit)
LRWSSAGHLPVLLLHDGRAELLETHPDLMLGVQHNAPRADHERTLEAGDVLVLFTDGLVEDRLTCVDVGLEQLLALVEQAAVAGPEALADTLVSRLGGGADDVAVLVVRVDGPPPGRDHVQDR